MKLFILCRTTKDFSIYLSDTSNTFDKTIVSGTLTDARNLDCDKIPIELFYFPEAEGRYVKFEINSYRGSGGGLKYIDFVPVLEGRSC